MLLHTLENAISRASSGGKLEAFLCGLQEKLSSIDMNDFFERETTISDYVNKEERHLWDIPIGDYEIWSATSPNSARDIRYIATHSTPGGTLDQMFGPIFSSIERLPAEAWIGNRIPGSQIAPIVEKNMAKETIFLMMKEDKHLYELAFAILSEHGARVLVERPEYQPRSKSAHSNRDV